MVGVRKGLFVNDDPQTIYDLLLPDQGLMNIVPGEPWESQHVKRIAENVQEHKVWLNYLSEYWMARAIGEGWVTSDESYARKMVDFAQAHRSEVAGFLLDDVNIEPYARLLDSTYYPRILSILKQANVPLMIPVYDGWTGGSHGFPPSLDIGDWMHDIDFPHARFGIEFTDVYFAISNHPADHVKWFDLAKAKFPSKNMWLALYPDNYPSEFKGLLEWTRGLYADGEIEGVWLYSSTELIENSTFLMDAIEVLNEPFPVPIQKGCVFRFFLPLVGLSTLLPSIRLLRSHLPRSIVKLYYGLSGFILQGLP